MTFNTLGLRPELLRALADAGYATPTPVQAQAIPLVLQGRDVLAGAQTGAGKTAAFALPLLQRLAQSPAPLKRAPASVRALILTPTRELAAQVEDFVREYGRYLPLVSAVVFGGVPINPQTEALRRGVDILVATPGRLLDHLGQQTVNLGALEVFILDEADRMLDMGFIRDIRKILALLPARRQNLLFSATFPSEIKTLAAQLMTRPALVDVPRASDEKPLITQTVYASLKEDKRDLLVHLLAEHQIVQALVFTRTKYGADKLAKQLGKRGISAAPIHGDRSQPQRTKALSDFKTGQVRILVATDIAARGLDIEQLPHVINFELPHVPEDYVHRIGRTGRAGTPGDALSLVSPEEESQLAGIEKLLQTRLPRRSPKGFVPAPPDANPPPATNRPPAAPQVPPRRPAPPRAPRQR